MNQPDWIQAIDQRLLTRVLKPMERPGLIGQEPTRRILASIERMRGSLPLLERVSRYLESGEFVDSGVPIVHARFPVPVANDSPEAARPPDSSVAWGQVRKANPALTDPEAASANRSAALPKVIGRPLRAPASNSALPQADTSMTPGNTTPKSMGRVAPAAAPATGTEHQRPTLQEASPSAPVSVSPSDPVHPPRIVLPAGRRRQRRIENEDAMPGGGSSPPGPDALPPGSPFPMVSHSPTLPATRRNHMPGAMPSFDASPELLPSSGSLSVRGTSRNQMELPSPSNAASPVPTTFSEVTSAKAVTPNVALVHRSSIRPATAASDLEIDGTPGPAATSESTLRKAGQPRTSGQILPPTPVDGIAAVPRIEEQQSLITDLIDKALRRFMRNLEVDRERRRMRP